MTRIVLDIDAVRFNHLGPVSKPDHLREIAERFEGNTLPGSNACATAADILDLVAEQLEHPSPLIVLDLSAFISDAALVADLRAGMTWGLNNIADQIEAQTKPDRIPEPGLWGVVEATYSGWHRGQWVHCDGDVWRSLRDDGHEWVTWTSLVEPTLIREGMS